MLERIEAAPDAMQCSWKCATYFCLWVPERSVGIVNERGKVSWRVVAVVVPFATVGSRHAQRWIVSDTRSSVWCWTAVVGIEVRSRP